MPPRVLGGLIPHPEASTVPLMPDRHRSQGMPEPKIRGDTWGRHPLPSDRLSAHDPPGRPGRPPRPAPRGLAPRWHLNGQPGGIDPARCGGMQGQQPREERQGKRRRNKEHRRLALLEDQIGQVAPNDLCECRQNEDERGPKQGDWLLMGGMVTPHPARGHHRTRTHRRVTDSPLATGGIDAPLPRMPS